LDGFIAADGAIELFVDSRAVRAVSMDVSHDWARWLQAKRHQIRGVRMLVQSRFLRLTAAQVRRSSGLGELMIVDTDPHEFDLALARAITG
jgi:hypothetical protein